MENNSETLALKELKKLEKYIEKKTAEEILEDSLDITYTKSLGSEKINNIEIVLSMGGPTSWLDLSESAIITSWGGVKKRLSLYDEKLDKKLDQLWDIVETFANA